MKRLIRLLKTTVYFISLSFLILAAFSRSALAGPFYSGIFGSYVIPDDLRVTGTSSSDLPLEKSKAFRGRTGYLTPADKWVALQWEYAGLPRQNIDQFPADGENRAQNLMTNLLFKYPSGKVRPYSGIGIGCSWSKAKEDLVDSSEDSLAWQLMAGVDYKILPNWSADFAYRDFTSRYEFDHDDGKGEDHALVVGLNYHF